MSSRSILILGAGLMQKPAIESAKSLGLKVFVIDANPHAVCVPLADVFKKIDLKAKEEIAQYAIELKEKENLASIFTAGTDFSASVSYASEKAGLLSHSYKAALNASDKTLMRTCFDAENVPSPKFIKIHRNQIVDILTPEFVSKITYPCVVKPVDNMGARGCRMIREKNELLFSVEEAIKNSRSGTCILEEYICGPEFSIDALVYNGTMTITGFADRHIYYPPYFIEMGHTMPTEISKEKYYELVKAFSDGVHALGLTRGSAKADIKYTENGPMIGEIAARLSGGYMSGWTYPYSSGLNLTECAIQIACGDIPEELEQKRHALPLNAKFKIFQVDSTKVSAERAWISIPGIVKKVNGLNEKYNDDVIRNIFPRVKAGDKVTFPRNNVEKCGNVISVSDNREIAVNTCEQLIQNIVIELESGNQETEAFLLGKNHHYEKDFPPLAYNISEEILGKLEVELEEKDFKIPDDMSVKNFIPQCLNNEETLSLNDWNHISMKTCLEKFDQLRDKTKKYSYRKFWYYLIHGGIQGALYAAE